MSGNKKGDVDYQFLADEEIFNGRYKVHGKKLGMVRARVCFSVFVELSMWSRAADVLV